jgi:hypothetical protein
METCACPNGIDIDEWPRVVNPECTKHGLKRNIVMAGKQETKPINSKLESLELVASCAKDVVDYWPNMSFKTIRIMIPKMQALKEALEMLK